MNSEATRGEPTLRPTVEPRDRAPMGEFTSDVRAHLDNLATALLACGNTEVLAVRATWDERCALSLEALNVERGISTCVAALAPTLQPSCADAGRLLHVVRAPSAQGVGALGAP